MFSNLQNRYKYSIILIRELVITGFKLRYQDSILGYLWSLLKPMFIFVILYVVLVGFLGIGADEPTWPVSLLLGIVLWNFFMEVTGTGLTSIVDRGEVIRKINFPKYVIVLSSGILALINLSLNFIVIAVFMIFKQIELSWLALLFPLFVLELFIFAMGIAFMLGALFVKLRDVNYIWEIVTQALFYGSVIMFPISIVIDRSRQFAEILLLNPIAYVVQESRYVLVNQDSNPTLTSLTGNLWFSLIPLGIVIITITVGILYFKQKSPYFAENI